MKTRFYFAVCQAGAEKAVKAEIGAQAPHLRFAFSRPGFITFKDDAPKKEPPELKNAIFVRLWGEILGQAKDAAALEELVSTIPSGSIVQAFERDLYLPGNEPPEFSRELRLAAALSGLPTAVGETLNNERRPSPGQAVYSLIIVDEGHFFLSRHRHTGHLTGQPGNAAHIPLPEASPSRAWLKIEEAIIRFRPEPSRGRRVLEVGCAPGGATTALLARGCRVTGVDPQFMDSRVAGNPNFSHIRKPARFISADDLRDCNPDWLVVDMSIAPLEALDELAHVVALLKKVHGTRLRLRNGFLTIKLNDWRFASSISLYLRRIQGLGFRDLCPFQLSSNRQEFFVWAPNFRP
ncbi:MAG: hypothetical protein JXX14_08755 [Deltaproteobacteria bacterium]|nr:hypothetical protein [Deltaproteobacteria bacterium]